MDHAADRAQHQVDVVLEHMRLENAHQFTECAAVFGHPRYEVVATGEVHDATDGVVGFLLENREAFADFHFTPSRVAAAGDAVLVEGLFTGTHTGTWRGLPATGRKLSLRMALVFDFEDDQLVCERLYFDLGTALRQLGVARDPMSRVGRIATALNHPLTVTRAAVRALFLGHRRDTV